ncbi:MAG TPA: peptide deformylase [Myxococcaceae bacterium]|nr:peptide deformylase [Myxococcaceae bacterium]
MEADPIVLWPDRVLSTPTQKVTDFGPKLRELLERMKRSVVEAEGIGLAANQIGVGLRVALVFPPEGELIEMVNPRITARRGEVLLDEACLSLPGEGEKVERALEVDVVYQDASGAEHTLTAKERLAHIVQHEVDHLDGLVYVQHVGQVKRDMIRKRMERRKKYGMEPDPDEDDDES